MSRVQQLNPVFDRELRQRSRSMRSMILMTLYLSLLVVVMYVVYKGTESTQTFNNDPISALTNRVGRSMFEWVLAAQMAVLLFIIPGISAGAIAGERDRQTLIPLQVTLMSPRSIFLGKVASSSSFVLLLLVASLPVMAVPYLVGGISLSQVVLALATLLATGFLLAVMGVACSAIFRRTQTATLAAYGLTLALTLGTLVGLAVLAVIDASRGTDTVEPRLEALYPNPFVGIADAAGDLGGVGDGPFSPIKEVFIRSQFGNDVWIENGVAFDPNTGEQFQAEGVGGLPIWVRSLLTQAGLAIVLAVLAIRRLRAPSREMHAT
ncbi:MAG: ABC transporter permease [Acidimicrobiales bacterium]